MKVLLILVDGMRPDAIEGLDTVQRLMKKASYTMSAETVKPSVTLPCHMSLFHSVDPARHGITVNLYTPQVRPVRGLVDALAQNGKVCASFYGWEELRDISRPGSLDFSYYCSGRKIGRPLMNNKVTDAAIDYIKERDADFVFLYLGYTDFAGHSFGWMSDEYMEAIRNSWDNIDRIMATLLDEWTVFITADHGGHDRFHGTELPEDMTIPLIVKGRDFAEGQKLSGVGIKDIAPTVAKLLGVEPDGEWEGRSLL